MMASAMMKETGPIGTVSDLAPTLTLGLKDDMWRLEAKGSESDVKVIIICDMANCTHFNRGSKCLSMAL